MSKPRKDVFLICPSRVRKLASLLFMDNLGSLFFPSCVLNYLYYSRLRVYLLTCFIKLSLCVEAWANYFMI